MRSLVEKGGYDRVCRLRIGRHFLLGKSGEGPPFACWRTRVLPEDYGVLMATILVDIGNNCNEYRAEFQADRVLVRLAEQRGTGTVGGSRVSGGGALARVPCPTCLQPTLERNGFYRGRQVKTKSPVGDVPGEYPEAVERIDLHKLHCINPGCEQPYHTILPSFLAPYGHYVHSVRQAVIEAMDTGATVYSVASKLQIFPQLIRRWMREGKELGVRVIASVLAQAQELSPVSLVSTAPEQALSPWRRLVAGVHLLVVELLRRNPEFNWSDKRLLEFIYLFCNGRRELRFWDRGGRRKKRTSHHIILSLPLPDPGG